MEDLLPKDNEKIPLPDFGTVNPTEVQPFAPDQMVRCEQCLRANPPTRVNCLYCSAALPVTDTSSQMQKPGLRRLEKWEHGINTILIDVGANLSERAIAEAADLLKLKLEDLQRIVSIRSPLPLARAATEDEATLIQRRLTALGLYTTAVADNELRLNDDQMIRIRSASVADDGIMGYQLAGLPGIELKFKDLVLLVLGRLFTRRTEVKERKSRRAEDDIVHASQFFADQAILDIYAGPESQTVRLEASSFDFSVLGTRKALVTGENLGKLVQLIRERAPQVTVSDAYIATRQALEPVWPSELRTEAIGWHRERPGRYSTSGATESSNEDQFRRYSRLQYYLQLKPPAVQRA